MKVENWNGHGIRFVDKDGEWWAFWAFITFADGRTAAGESAKVFVWEEGR
jgi:hypothetical protein